MKRLIAPHDRSNFSIAIICALTLEAEAIRSTFDVCWDDQGKSYGKAVGDQNAYTTGSISGHNVVLVHMSGMGSISAAQAATSLRSSYSNIQLALVIGICGVIPLHPETDEEIILGDIIVATAVIQYDFGRQYPNGLRRKKEVGESLGRASPELRALMNKLQMRQSRHALSTNLQSLIHSNKIYESNPAARYPGAAFDRLYAAGYTHQHQQPVRCDLCNNNREPCTLSCDQLGCEDNQVVIRQRLRTSNPPDLSRPSRHSPHVHFGRIGSANMVMRSGTDRDNIAAADNIIAFEMEGAGVWDQHPTMVIKAACDYADSHKNKVWQAYAATIAAIFTKVILREWPQIDNAMPEESSGPIVHLPFEHIPGFIGRVDELRRIKHLIYENNNNGRVISILGLGGVGKSRLALELAYQVQFEHPQRSIFWIQGATRLNMEKDMLEIGRKLAIPGIDSEGADIKALVKQRLSIPSRSNWLLIIDNADDEELWTRGSDPDLPSVSLSSFLPNTSAGSILITTRTRAIATFLSGKHVITLGEMSSKEAVKLFRYNLENPDLADNASTSELVEKLAYLPLAITQASSFLNRTQESAQTYLDLLDQTEDHTIGLLSKDFEEPHGHQRDLRPVATTWLVSFNQIRSQHPVAATYLSCMACLCEKSIPLSLLPRQDRSSAIEAIAVLTGYSFIKRQGDQNNEAAQEPLYDMHRLVHVCIRAWLKQEGRLATSTEQGLKTALDRFPTTEHEEKTKWKIYLPHGSRLCADPHVHDLPERYALLELMAAYWIFTSNYTQAFENLRTVVSWRNSALGPLAKDTLRASSMLGRAFIGLGDYPTAYKMLQRTVDGQVSTIGIKHAHTLYSMTILANAHSCQGRYAKAEQVLLEVLAEQTELLGLENYDTMVTIDKLALAYKFQHRLEEAEKLQKEILARSEKVLGVEHPATVTRIAALVSTHRRQHRYSEAEELGIKAVRLQTKLHGADHLRTQDATRDLAMVYASQGRNAKAEELQLKTIECLRRTLGSEHPDVFCKVADMGSIYLDTHRYQEAETLYTECLDISKRTLGPHHPHTLTIMQSLALSLNRLGRESEARYLIASCMNLQSEHLGPENPQTQTSRMLLAQWSQVNRQPQPQPQPEPQPEPQQLPIPSGWRKLWRRAHKDGAPSAGSH